MRKYPEIEEVFGLTLNGKDSRVHPWVMVGDFGFNPEGWSYSSRFLTGRQTRSFKLVSAGSCSSWEELIKRLKARGRIPRGQWLVPFKEAFQPDGRGPVGVADSSWLSPGSNAHFPYVHPGGYPSFRPTAHAIHDVWRWIVEVG